MKKIKLNEFFTIIISTVVSVVIVVGALRFYAPQLLGISSDIQLVKTAKKVPPFFDGIFRKSDYESSEFIIPDPIIKRAKPLFPDLGGIGPNDLLGFRNRSVPNIADLIIIGDSQTYGNNASLKNNWPNLLLNQLHKKNRHITHYDLAVGGWGAIEYLEIFYKSLVFQPRMVIVAFYTGNDPLETFRMAYSNKRWKAYRTDTSLSSSDMPYVEFPPPITDQWNVDFADKITTVFTPKNRLHSNEKNKVVKAGYDAMLLVAEEIAKVCIDNDISLIYTIIPTKELVYKKKVDKELVNPPSDYTKLVNQEKEYINWFEGELSKIENAQYINVVNVMQEEALQSKAMYPNDTNGHPIAYGYKIIANQLAKNVEINWSLPEGLVALFTDESKYQLGLVRDGNYWSFSHPDVIEANGWDPATVPVSLRPRDLANFTKQGVISVVNREMFGPR